VIDDEEPILDMTSRILREFGYRTITAASGERGVAIFRERHHEIDLTITDIMMPGMDGTETVTQILAIDPEALFIAVSGIRTNEEIIRNSTPNVRTFIHKPYSAATLLKTIASALSENSE
jgi:DNA-binding NtrC family response regulator